MALSTRLFSHISRLLASFDPKVSAVVCILNKEEDMAMMPPPLPKLVGTAKPKFLAGGKAKTATALSRFDVQVASQFRDCPLKMWPISIFSSHSSKIDTFCRWFFLFFRQLSPGGFYYKLDMPMASIKSRYFFLQTLYHPDHIHNKVFLSFISVLFTLVQDMADEMSAWLTQGYNTLRDPLLRLGYIVGHWGSSWHLFIIIIIVLS